MGTSTDLRSERRWLGRRRGLPGAPDALARSSPAAVSITVQPVSAEAVLRRVDWHLKRVLDGHRSGDYRSVHRGVGVDVRDLREYEPGDDVRHIDWNVTARMDAPYVREFIDDRNVTVWLVLDRSPSMTFGPIDRPKELVQAELALTVARLFAREGNRVGALLFDDTVRSVVPAGYGRTHLLRLARTVLSPTEASGNATDLSQMLAKARRTIPRRSLVVLVSDFISPPGWSRELALLRLRHDVIAIRLFEPREFALPDAGIVVMKDTETGEQLEVDTSDPVFRRRLHDASVARDAALAAEAKQAGTPLYSIAADADVVRSLAEIARSRGWRR